RGDKKARGQRRNHPGANKRGLAAAGRTDDRQKSGCMQPLQQLVGLLFAAEEKVGLFYLERSEPRIRRLECRHCIRPSDVSITLLTSASFTPPLQLITFILGSIMERRSLGSGGPSMIAKPRKGSERRVSIFCSSLRCPSTQLLVVAP